MEPIGPRLKAAREKKGISIEQAQKDTRIQARILFALEDDRIDEAVSSAIYAKSFLKKYADYLGLDGAAISEEYKAAHSVSAEQILSPSGREKKQSDFRFPLKPLLVFLAGALIIFFGVKVLIFAGSKIKSALKPRPRIEKEAPAARPKETAKRTVPKVIPEKRTSISEKPVDSLVLSIKTKSNVWLKIKSDNTLIFEGTLKRGSDESWKAKNSFEISASRAEAVIAELNGVSLGSLGKGVMKDIMITRDGVRLNSK